MATSMKPKRQISMSIWGIEIKLRIYGTMTGTSSGNNCAAPLRPNAGA